VTKADPARRRSSALKGGTGPDALPNVMISPRRAIEPSDACQLAAPTPS
jgi:hypothetical protein